MEQASHYDEELPEASGVDSYFVGQVKDFISNELESIDPEDVEGRFFVFQTALQMIINQCPTMSSLLSLIEDCYRQVIELYTDKSRATIGEEVSLSRAINCQASIKHQEKRLGVLDNHFLEVKKENDALRKELQQIEQDIDERKRLYYPEKPEDKKEEHINEADMKYFMLTAIDDTIVEMDVPALEKRLADLVALMETTTSSASKEWIPIDEYVKLEEKMLALQSKRTEYARKCSNVYLRHERLRYAVNALREVVSDEARVATVGEAILRTFKTFKPDKKESFIDFLLSLSEQSSNYRGTNLGEQKDTQIASDVDMSLAEWLKKTHRLLSNGSYKEAAETAASAPSGVLCNLATLEAFKAITPENAPSSESSLPVLFYLEAVLGPLTSHYVLSEKFVTACVSVALEYDCFWLLSSWVAKQRLPFSCEVVKLFLANGNSRYLPLAESLCRSALFDNPSSMEFAKLLLTCLIKQNRISAAVLHIRQFGLTSEDCAGAFLNDPSSRFLHEIVKQADGKLASLLALFEALPVVAKDTQHEENVQRIQLVLAARELIDDELVVLIQNEKRQNPQSDTLLQNVSIKISNCGMPDIAARLLL